MKSKDIFSELDFTSIPEEKSIISETNINKISKMFDTIFESAGVNEQVYITKTLEDEAYAVSTAEDSSLSPEEAANIEVTEEQSLRVIKYQKKQLPIEKKYEELEYENVMSTSRQVSGMGFKHLNIDILCQLHHDLSIGLDEYAKPLKITKYHPGSLRENNTVKVGKFPPYIPPEHKNIKKLLNTLFIYYQEKEKIHLVDIIEFGVLLYAIHPFQNGNKRIVRILESALLNFYGYSAKKTISLGRAYAMDKNGFNFFLLSSLKDRNTTAFVNFTLRRYTEDGKLNMVEVINNEAREKLKKRILCFSNEKKHIQFQKAFELFQKNSFLKNSKFTELMKKFGYGYSVSQGILKTMLEENVLNKVENGNYVFSGFRQYVKLTRFIEEHIRK